MNTQPIPAPENGKKHSLVLTDRCGLSLCGITDVLNFDEEVTVFMTSAGMLTVEGEGLHVRKLLLENGEVELDGKIFALYYSDRTEKKKKHTPFGIFG